MPRAWPSSSRLVGCRWAMPSTARSGSTWRTGHVRGRRLPLAPGRHALRHGPGPRAQRLGVLQLQPGQLGRRRPGRPRPQLLARLFHPRPAAQRCSSADRRSCSCSSHATSDSAYAFWAVRQRPPQPVREPVTLGRRDAQLALQERRERRRPVAHEPSRDLCVEQVGTGWRRRRGSARRGPAARHAPRASAGVSNNRGQRPHVDARAGRRGPARRFAVGRRRAAPRELQQRRGVGSRCRSRWNSVSIAYRGWAASSSINRSSSSWRSTQRWVTRDGPR